MKANESARLRKMAEDRGGSVQGDHVPRPGKKVRAKSLSMSNPETKGVIVCVKNNEAVKYWKDEPGKSQKK